MKTSRSDARKQAEEALANLDECLDIDWPPSKAECSAFASALRALLAEQDGAGLCEVCRDLLPAPSPASDEVREAVRAFRDLLSDPADLESPASLVASGMWQKEDGAAPFWTEAGLYGRVGKEAARTLLARHRKAREALAALDARGERGE